MTAWALDRMTFKQVLIGTTMRKVRACMVGWVRGWVCGG